MSDIFTRKFYKPLKIKFCQCYEKFLNSFLDESVTMMPKPEEVGTTI